MCIIKIYSIMYNSKISTINFYNMINQINFINKITINLIRVC